MKNRVVALSSLALVLSCVSVQADSLRDIYELALENDAQLKVQAKALNTLGEELRKSGMTLAYHTHDAEMRQMELSDTTLQQSYSFHYAVFLRYESTESEPTSEVLERVIVMASLPLFGADDD